MFVKYDIDYYDDSGEEPKQSSGICYGENTADCVSKIMEYYGGERMVGSLSISYHEMYECDVLEKNILQGIGL